MFSLLSTYCGLDYSAKAEVIAKSMFAGFCWAPDTSSSWPCGEQWIQAEAGSFHGIKVWKDKESHSFLHERRSCNGRYRYFSHPSLVLAYCSKDIREMSSMSHERECQACWAAIGCIISFLLAPIWMPGEELCRSQFSQGSCGLFLSEQYNVALSDLNVIKIFSKNNFK